LRHHVDVSLQGIKENLLESHIEHSTRWRCPSGCIMTVVPLVALTGATRRR
jgi:hypothetical protein